LDCYSLLQLSATQPAASRTALARQGLMNPYPPPLTAGCFTESGSRLPQSRACGGFTHAFGRKKLTDSPPIALFPAHARLATGET
jgi:hypothetical protein